MKKWIVFLLALSMIGLIFWSCSESSTDPKPDAPPVYVNEGMIGDIGGTVKMEDASNPLNGAYIKIPEGALDAEVKIKISNANGLVYLPGDSTAQIIKIEPEGLQFKKPVEIAIPFNGAKYSNSLKIWNIDEVNNTITQLPSEFDSVNGIVKASIIHLSFYAMGDNVHANVFTNYSSGKLRINMCVEGWALGNNLGFAGIMTNKLSWPFGIYNAKQAIDDGAPLVGDLVISYFNIKVKKKIAFWYDDTIAENKILVKRIGDHNLGFGGSVYLKNLTSGNLKYSAEKMNSDQRSAYFSGKALVIEFNVNLENDKEYYIVADWGIVGDINATLIGGRYTALYSLNTSDNPLLVSEMHDMGFSDTNSNFIDDAYEIPNVPPVPMLVSPTNGSTVQDFTPTFDWSDVTGATSYTILGDNNSDFSSPEITQSPTGSTYTPTTDLTAGTYYWKVLSTNAAGSSSYTGAWSVIVKNPSLPAEVVFVQGGTFQMGDHFAGGYSNELPVHSVTVNDFYIGVTEVTQKEWSDIMGSNPSSGYGVGDTYPVYYITWYSILKYCNLRSIAEGLTPCYTISSSNDPADWGSVPTSFNSTWNAVICNWSANGYRLPTEAEWEYAARAGIHNADNYHYSGSDVIDDVAWYESNSGSTTHPVGTKLPNQLGIYDMSGNLCEWCWDWYGSSYYTTCNDLGTVTDPYGPSTGSTRVLRGGFWGNPATYLRVTYRSPYGYPNNSMSGTVSFRLSRTP